ncbi:NAD-dependent epimerase/dehydratase family protein, partial [Frankia sp. R82]|uniref:NAD-dependent epimerase/dehydratase family protein n=1 Tax=Frankia sp. R82 TaxID=2950553 RepID=UPI0020439A30
MRVAIVGATGNIGYALLHTLLADSSVEEVVGIARRLPTDPVDARVRWTSIDIADPDAAAPLTEAFLGCSAVVHVAWLIQPSRRRDLMRATNVDGSARVLEAVRAAAVPALVYASSVGTYAAAPVDVDGSKGGLLRAEDWPTTGIPTSAYSRHKAEVERLLDRFELTFPACRVVRIRPGIVLSGTTAAAQTRYFVGPLLPRRTLGALLRGRRRGRLPLAPAVRGLEFQVVHTEDAATAFAAAVRADVRGPFNVATTPVVDPRSLPAMIGGRPVRLPAKLVRGLVWLGYRARLVPIDEGWIDLALGVPLMDTGRARDQLRWRPEHDAGSVLRAWLAGAAAGAGRATPVL